MPRRAGVAGNARALLGWCAIGGVALLVLLAGTDGAARAQAEGAEEALLGRGGELYAANCAACHGPRGEGGPGETGLTVGPPLVGVEVAYVDQQMRTGRMPLIDRTAGVVRSPELDDDERQAVLAWMDAEIELVGALPSVDIGEGDLSRGQELYTTHCAACHGSVGNGGISGRGVAVLGLRGIDPIAMVEAIRVGPYNMPAFGEQLLSDQEAVDIAAFTSEVFEEPETTVLGLAEQNRVGLAAMAVLLLLAVLAGTVLVAHRVRLPTRDEGGEVG